MSTVFPEDPDWALGIAPLMSSITGGAKTRLWAEGAQEDINTKRLAREQMQRRMDAAKAATDAQTALTNQGPQPPLVKQEVLPGVLPLDAPPRAVFTDPQSQQAVDAYKVKNAELMRDLTNKEYNLASQHVTSYGDVATNRDKMLAGARLRTQGLPTNQNDLITMQTQLTGTLPTQLFDQKAGSNYQSKDANGNVVAQYYSTDNGRTALGRPINHDPSGSILKMGDASANQNPMDDAWAGTQIKNAFDKVGIRKEQLSPQDAANTALALELKFKESVKLEKDAYGATKQIILRDTPIAQSLMPVVNAINAALAAQGGGPPPAAGAGAPGASFAQPPGGWPGAPGAAPPAPAGPGALAGAPAATTAPPPPNQPPPILPPNAIPALSNETRVGATVLPGSGMDLAKEFGNEKPYTNYILTRQFYGQIEAALKNNNPSADIAAVYAFISMMDPKTGVRDPEVKMVASAGALAETLKGKIDKIWGEGGLRPEVRRDMMNEVQKVLDVNHAMLQPVLRTYQRRAELGGIDPAKVIPDMPDHPQYDPRNINIEGHAPTTQRTGPGPVRATDQFDQEFGVGR